MSVESQLAVEINKGTDHLNIWVDANNNGVRDDDDVNIYVTAGGGFYTTSPTFKQALDETIQTRIKALAVALLQQQDHAPAKAEETLCELALELVVKATKETTDTAIAYLASLPPREEIVVQETSVEQQYAAPVIEETYAAHEPYVEPVAYADPAIEQQYEAAEQYMAQAEASIEAVASEQAYVEEQAIYVAPAETELYAAPVEQEVAQGPQAFTYDAQPQPTTLAPIWINLSAPKQ